ncbi:xanthine dehydrogenase family protein molybdopterin-binding subunit [Tianweitania sediminis]|uniref:Xanthine dehydrogenase family protein molybdopterin-binding subunit n=1 Tax=Tianweitania sediminis TaxID=1502156 RepID=A0A8J7RRS3_9HYPH|nr:xanthine dehydrogenase family protein molybdopterin-binding subunit [Tianweitania sediminis]MBP0440859.1 xanthine dehydrogenase family protein molybdopterin-binding subunit [Tianweitania sediminis]
MSTSTTASSIGQPLSRIDGPAKVTGRAKYAAEHAADGLAYGWVVSSAIAKGKVKAIHEEAARAVPGVIEILTHKNRPHVAWFDRSYRDQVAPPGEPFRALYDDEIKFSFQPLALVLAKTLEAARAAAALLRIDYIQEEPNTDFENSLEKAYVPPKKRSGIPAPASRGDAQKALDEAHLKVTADYASAAHHHNPMEMHATTVIYGSDGALTVYDKTQGSQNVKSYLVGVFGLANDKVTVRNPYVGGAFGSGLRPHYQVYLATMAALYLKRSARVTLTRQQMVSHVRRPETFQSMALGASEAGGLQSIINSAVTATSTFEDYQENVVNWGVGAYRCADAAADYKLVALDTPTPGDMRAPGAATGMTLFECAMDELSYAVGVDPLQLRLLNYAEVDPISGNPFTSKALREAYDIGAERFGWGKRPSEPRAMRDGNELTGWGMATGMWDATFQKTSARARISANGGLEVATAASDIGTGTYTIIAQVASETLGLPTANIDVKIGDSDLPASPIEGGSWMAASSSAAVQLACQSLGTRLFEAAQDLDGSPFKDIKFEAVSFNDGRIIAKDDPSRFLSITDIMKRADLPSLEVVETAGPGLSGMVSQVKKARATHSAIFAEVKVDDELGVVRVTRIVVAVAAGRILNPKTARSQIMGGVVMGMGMALHEESMMDTRFGRPMNHNFAEYHIPVNADIHGIDVIFVEEEDKEVSPLGVKGLGEIGIVGTAAAIASAVFHATGTRVRKFPITLDKLI